PRIDVPVFLVGSGPSLDHSLPTIRANAEKAIIVSLGSALRPLMRAGIKPDFQIEIENVFVYPLVSLVAEKFDLSSICLVAATTVDRHILKFFDRKIFFFRFMLSPYPLFAESERSCLINPDPTVVNAGLSFAQEMGFRQIYFFGVDLGTRDVGQHHSKDAYQYADGSIPEWKKYTIPLRGNFGGTVYSANDFAFALSNIVTAIAMFKESRQYLNCSDGVLIDGATPLRADAVSLGEIPGGKTGIVDRMAGGFPVYTKDRFDSAWNKDRLFAEVNGFVDRMIMELRDAATFEKREILVRKTEFLRRAPDRRDAPDRRFNGAALRVFRGTCLCMLSVVEYFMQRLSDTKRHDDFVKIAKDEFIACIERLRATAIEILSHPTEVPVITNEGVIDRAGIMPEVTASWGKVGRNDPCPCGSGKRYKRCHGRLG
ncbi:MAG TPA: 6-hydroxymethylpterin diphosphokinase MptE-like protein, partial [Rhodospirillales bacterium]